MGESIPAKSKTARVKQAFAALLDAARLQPHAQAPKGKSSTKPAKGKAK